MYLVVDRGNTLTKIALFRGSDLVDLRVLTDPGAAELQALLDEFGQQPETGPIEYGIYSSVVTGNEAFVHMLGEFTRLLVLDKDCRIPIANAYGTPGTLGNDRIAAAVGAFTRFPGKNILTIDSGTCVTYDMVSAAGEYLGGGISPGIKLRYRALHTFTSKLPLVTGEQEAPLVGSTTEGSIQSGVLNGMLAELDGIIDRYREEYRVEVVLVTGGDAKYFDKKLKNNIFAVPNLVLSGLRDILQYNVES